MALNKIWNKKFQKNSKLNIRTIYSRPKSFFGTHTHYIKDDENIDGTFIELL